MNFLIWKYLWVIVGITSMFGCAQGQFSTLTTYDTNGKITSVTRTLDVSSFGTTKCSVDKLDLGADGSVALGGYNRTGTDINQLAKDMGDALVQAAATGALMSKNPMVK